jgi:hypothetical protein
MYSLLRWLQVSDGNRSFSAPKALIIGLVVSLILLTAICAVAAFLLFRRVRRRRQREREQTSTRDTAPIIDISDKQPMISDVVSEKAESSITVPAAAAAAAIATDRASSHRTSHRSRPSRSSRISRAFSATSQAFMRARTPGGSSAIPVPYDPSEISEDASAHFTFFPQDEEIGVPVPYPLALHVPARVAKAMEERDERWKEYEQTNGGGTGHRRPTSSMTVPGSPDDFLYYSDPTRPDVLLRRSSTSRRSTRASTLSSIDDGGTTTSGGYGTHYNPSSNRSDVGKAPAADVDDDDRMTEDGRLSVVAEFPTPPSPSSKRLAEDGTMTPTPALYSRSITGNNNVVYAMPHTLRRFSRSPPLPPVPHSPNPTNSSNSNSPSPERNTTLENPFASNSDSLHDGGRSEEISTETGTVIIRGVSAVVGTARAVVSPIAPAAAHPRVVQPEQGLYRESEATYSTTAPSENPFEDVTLERDYQPERDSSVYAGVVDLETVDGHTSSTFAFPAPPKPSRQGSPV